MAKPQKLVPTLVVPIEQKALGQSKAYKIIKYGLYRYQLVTVDSAGSETPIGVDNVFNVVASDLAERLWNETNTVR